MTTRVEITTFKGCQPTVDLQGELEDLIEDQSLDVELVLTLVPSPDQAEAMGLYGSPTIQIDGREVQPKGRGPAGFF